MLFLVLASKPLGGFLSDRFGRRRLMLIIQIVAAGLFYPALHFMLLGSPTHFAVGQLMLAVPLGMALGLQGAMLVEIFPVASRVTSMSIAYSVTLALAGGIAPLLAKSMITWFGDPLAPAYFIFGHALIGLIIMLRMRETNGRSLSE